jgi:hypothetical protein
VSRLSRQTTPWAGLTLSATPRLAPACPRLGKAAQSIRERGPGDPDPELGFVPFAPAFPGILLAAAVDGARYHLVQQQWQRDLRQRRELGRLALPRKYPFNARRRPRLSQLASTRVSPARQWRCTVATSSSPRPSPTGPRPRFVCAVARGEALSCGNCDAGLAASRPGSRRQARRVGPLLHPRTRRCRLFHSLYPRLLACPCAPRAVSGGLT